MYKKYITSVTEKTVRNIQLKIRFCSAGVHVFNRKTGQNILIDEFIPPFKLWATAPRQMSIALTNECDLTCFHCYAPKNFAMLDFKKLKEWLTELDGNGCMGVGFGGGEPTFYPWLAELCSFAVQKTQLAVTMTTHGHNLSAEFLKTLKGNLHFARVSMDGVGKTYESIRKQSFNNLIRNIIALSNIVNFGINFVVNSKTIGDIDAAVHIAEELGAAELLLLPEEPVRGEGGIDVKTTAALQSWVYKYRGRVALSISEGHSEGLPTCNPLSGEAGLAAFGHIDASGFLKRTSYDTNGIQILENGIMEAFNKLKVIKQEVIL